MSNYERALEWRGREEIYRSQRFLVGRNEAQEMRMARRAALREANIVYLGNVAIKGVVQLEKQANAAIRDEPGAEFAIRNIQANVSIGLLQALDSYWNRS